MVEKSSGFLEENSFFPEHWMLRKIYRYEVLDTLQDRAVLAITFEAGASGQSFGAGSEADTWDFQLRWNDGQLEFIDRAK